VWAALILQRGRLMKTSMKAAFSPLAERRWRQPDEGQREGRTLTSKADRAPLLAGVPCRNRTCEPALTIREANQKPPENRRSESMNWDRIEGNWEQFKGQIRQQWGKLTDDDLEVIHGSRQELAGRIQERYGKAKDEAEREIDDWLTRH
jgi:uncharacterized protein YjbJ (UPF0337 family)